MPKKNYKGRIKTGLDEMLADEIRHTPLVKEQTTDADVGEIFRMVAWGVGALPGMSPVRRAFEETQLDPNNPYCWADLLHVFTNVHYFPGNPGRKRHRSVEYDEQLSRDLDLLREKYSGSGDAAISKTFLNEEVGKKQMYKALKKPGGVRSAINALKKRKRAG